jgi:hypothetical protein
MIRSPYFSEVADRYNTYLNTTAKWLDHYIGRYRWTSAVAVVGGWKDDTIAALTEFFPDAEVVALSKWPESELALFGPENDQRFGVVLVSVPSHQRLSVVSGLRRTVKVGGLLIADGAVEADWIRVEDCGPFTISYAINCERWA